MDPSVLRETEREVERIADRLRILGPRLAQDPELTVQHDGDGQGVLQVVRIALKRLADLAADAEGLQRHQVPSLPPHALADQLLVLGYDALRASAHPGAGTCDETDSLEVINSMLTELRNAL